MSKLTMDQVRASGAKQMMYNWKFQLTKAPNSGSYPDSAQLDVRCVSAELPKMTILKTESNIRGHKTQENCYGETVPQITLTFEETIDGTINDFIKAWRDACYNVKTGVQGKKEDVEAIITLFLLDGEGNETREYKLFGCFYEDTDPGVPDNTPEIFRPTLTLSLDYFEENNLN